MLAHDGPFGVGYGLHKVGSRRYELEEEVFHGNADYGMGFGVLQGERSRCGNSLSTMPKGRARIDWRSDHECPDGIVIG
jgi:hypothetical protein